MARHGFVFSQLLILTICLLLTMTLTACSNNQAELPNDPRTASAFSLRAVDSTEQQALSCPAELHEQADGSVLISSTGEIASHSLYLHLGYEPQGSSVVSVSLSPGLEGRALLLSIADEPGLLRLGLAAIGSSAKLPAHSELVSVSFSRTPQSGAVRSASVAPATAVADLQFSSVTAELLEWTFYVNGDYDQNGVVTIGDVTPIGQHFGKTDSAASWSVAQVADGDRNGLISISDLTPIGANFGSRVSSFAVREGTGVDGPFSFVAGSITDFVDFPQPQSGGPRRFSHLLANPVDGGFYTVSARDGAEEAVALSNAVLCLLPNQLPSVQIELEQASIPPGGQASLNAQYQDSDGTIEAVRWDLDGDGSFETQANVADAAVITPPLTVMGPAEVGIRVTDNEGQHGYDTAQLMVEFGLPALRLIESGDAYIEPSLELINGRPMAAYAASTAFDLRFVRATTDSGVNWFSPDTLVNNYEITGVDLAEISSQPAIAVGEESDYGLYFRSTDTLGADWSFVNALPPNQTGDYCSGGICLVERGGLPAVVYGGDGEITHGNVWYARALDVSGSNWQEPEAINSGLTDYGTRPSLSIINNRVHVAFMGGSDMQSAQIFHVRSQNIQDSSFTTPVAIGTPAASYGGSPALAMLDSGLPAVAFWNAAVSDISFTSADSADFLSWSGADLVAPASQTSSNLSLSVINDLPCIAYYDNTLPGFRLVCAMDAAGTLWNDPVDVASANQPGQVSLTDMNGRPMLLFSDVAAQELNFVVYQQPAG